MQKPYDTKFAVFALSDDNIVWEMFDSYDEAAANVRDVLIPRALLECGDLDGEMPDWLGELMIVQVLADVVNTPDGLKVARRV